jgi:hypothetical protein
LAEWLNSAKWFSAPDSGKARSADFRYSVSSPAANLIGSYVTAVSHVGKHGFADAKRIRELFARGVMGRPLLDQVAIAQLFPDEAFSMAGLSGPTQAPTEGACLPMQFRAELRPRGRGIEFKLVPEDEGSRWLYMWGELLTSGNATRLRLCPYCDKFWYCAVRADKRFCSDTCKVSFWQKTAKGKEAKKQYMRRYRADERRRVKKSALSGSRRKLSSGILANLGK